MCSCRSRPTLPRAAAWVPAGPYLDDRVLQGAALVGLPRTARGLRNALGAAADDGEYVARIGALLVRATLDDEVADTVRSALRAH